MFRAVALSILFFLLSAPAAANGWMQQLRI